MLIGIDPHKSTHTATAVEPGTNHEVASIRIDASLRRVPPNADLGQAMAAAPVGGRERRRARPAPEPRGCSPAAKTSSTCPPPRPPGSGNCPAAAAARTTASTPPPRPVWPRCRATPARLEAEGHADALAVLDERRVNLAQSRVRAVNQLHALLRALLAGGAPRDLSAATAAAAAAPVRPSGAVERARKAVARDLVAEIRSLDTQLKANARAIARAGRRTGSTLPTPSASGRSWPAG